MLLTSVVELFKANVIQTIWEEDMQQKWQYHTLKLNTTGWFVAGTLDTDKLTECMNDLGASGWELVSAFDTNTSSGASRDVIALFKKPR